MFCKRCAKITRRLSFDPDCEPWAELWSGSCIWDDEISREWCWDCVQKTRYIFHVRYQITTEESVDPPTLAWWQQLEREFPTWPVFRPERRSPELAERFRRMVRHSLKRTCLELERWERDIDADS